MRAWSLALGLGVAAGPVTADGEPVTLLAAGSLRAALGEVAEAHTAATGVPVEAAFAPSGLLRDRIVGGGAADVFASANLEHPRAIAAERGGEVRPFARNTLCGLAQGGLARHAGRGLLRDRDADAVHLRHEAARGLLQPRLPRRLMRRPNKGYPE